LGGLTVTASHLASDSLEKGPVLNQKLSILFNMFKRKDLDVVFVDECCKNPSQGGDRAFSSELVFN
jgi:hypothetical protein